MARQCYRLVAGAAIVALVVVLFNEFVRSPLAARSPGTHALTASQAQALRHVAWITGLRSEAYQLFTSAVTSGNYTVDQLEQLRDFLDKVINEREEAEDEAGEDQEEGGGSGGMETRGKLAIDLYALSQGRNGTRDRSKPRQRRRNWSKTADGKAAPAPADEPPESASAEEEAAAAAAAAAAAGAGKSSSSSAGSSGGQEALPASLPPDCAADYHFWLPHIRKSLRWWPPGSISPEMVAEPEYMVDLHVQVVRGKAYWRRMPEGWFYSNRDESLLFNIMEVMMAWPNVTLPDVEFRISPADSPLIALGGHERGDTPPRLIAPILSMCQRPDMMSIAVPDYSFSHWFETGKDDERLMHYRDLIVSILDASHAMPYSRRHKKALFRGKLENDDRNALRYILEKHANIIDAGISPATDAMEPHLAMADFPKYRVQLYVSGNGYSARLKYLLASGSPVVMYMTTFRGDMTEWFFPELIPYVHYVPAYHPEMVPYVIKWLLAHPLKGYEIGKNARAFVEQHLMHHNVMCWWRAFLAEYATRQKGPVKRVRGTVRMPVTTDYREYEWQFRRVSPQHFSPIRQDDYWQ